jgi:hypothetical protein
MDGNRRQFLRQVGIALAALAAGGCCGTALGDADTPPGGEGDTPDVPPPPKTPWGQVRAAWADLDRLKEQPDDYEAVEKLRDDLVAKHHAALKELVAAGEVRKPVADDMQAAFSEAAHHVWRANAPISCYEPVPWPQYDIDAASNLAQQADALEELGGTSDIDPAVLEQARKAVQRDIEFIALPAGEQHALQRGNEQTWAGLFELELEANPDAAEAANLLVEVLLGRKE